MIQKIKFQQFTAFKDLEIRFSPGINIFIGPNATGKTHILKAVYAACDISKSQKSLAEKMYRVFLPSREHLGRLVKRAAGSTQGSVKIYRYLVETETTIHIGLTLSNHTKSADKATQHGNLASWREHPLESVYIPVKDMMANAPKFRSLYNYREIHFEEVYADIIDRAFLGPLRGAPDAARKGLLEILQRSMEGKVISKNEEFFLKNKQGELEFTLVAEGLRKLALLWLLIQNGVLFRGSILCWDEPEANLNPSLMETVVEILVALQKMGVQIFLATHDYIVLKWFDLKTENDNNILYHSLYKNKEDGEIALYSTNRYSDISPNSIDEAFAKIVDMEIQRAMRKVNINENRG